MERKRRGPNLFEVMSKAPQVQYPAIRRDIFGRLKSAGQRGPVPTVAQPLTEAEAAEELAAGLRAEQERRQVKEARRAEKEARKEAAKAAKATAKIEAAKARAARTAAASLPTSAGPMVPNPVRVVRGRLTVSFNAAVCVVVAGALCGLTITAYTLGRRTTGTNGESALVPAAAKPAEFSATPLIPSLGKPRTKAAKAERPPSPDLSRLLDKPAEQQPEPGVAANSPSKPAEEGAVDETAAAKQNYLQIESFLITRERSGDVVVKDLEDVRRFLGERGIKTVARRHSNGYVLYSDQGFLPDRENAKQRETFRKRIEALGQEYRRSGGQYEFKGCDYVGYSRTKAGQPA